MAVEREPTTLEPVKSTSATAKARADGLTPVEEAAQGRRDQKGAIVLDTGRLNLPKAIIEEENQERRLLTVDPVVLFIFCLALAFIGFMAYLISKEP